jgi:hypothetical protein
MIDWGEAGEANTHEDGMAHKLAYTLLIFMVVVMMTIIIIIIIIINIILFSHVSFQVAVLS